MTVSTTLMVPGSNYPPYQTVPRQPINEEVRQCSQGNLSPTFSSVGSDTKLTNPAFRVKVG